MDCPNETTLRNFLRGELADDVSNQIVVHVDQCSDCEAVLQRLENEPDPVLDPLHPAFQEGIVGSDSQPADSGLREQWRVLGTALSYANGLPFPDVAPERPQPLGQYELLEPIGRGGMGAVYRARHTKLGRTVAIKILPARSQRSPAAVARFEREMLAVGALNHPHIVHATDAAETNGVHFLVMEHVDGIDVGSLARTLGQLDVPNACEIVRQAALGLQHAHEKGLIHRDVKPSNLILSKEGTVKLLDLGLALLQQENTPADGLTSTNQVMGTLDYMAPEQADNSHTVDVRADLYSLGATLFRLLTGVAPLDTHNCRTPLQKLSALIHKPRTNITDLRADLPTELADLVQSLLASNPAERPPSAKEIIERLTPLSQPHRLCDLSRKFTIARDTGSTERPETQFPISSMQSDTGVTPQVSSQVTSDRNSVGWDSVPTGRDGVPTYGKRTAKRSRLLVAVSLLTILTAIAAWSWNRFGPKDSRSEFAGSATGAPVILFDANTIKPSPSASGDNDSKTNSSTTKAAANSEPPRPQPIAWTPGPTENVPIGILPAPAAFPKLGRWQIESKAPRGQITYLKWSPDGRWFACVSADNVVRVYRSDGSKLEFHAALPVQPYRVKVIWSPDSQKLATVGESRDLLIWQIDEPKLIRTITADYGLWLSQADWSPDGTRLVATGAQWIVCWDINGKRLWQQRSVNGKAEKVCWHPTQPLIAIGGQSEIRTLDADTGELRTGFQGHGSEVSALAWSPSGRFLASGASGWNQPNGDTSVRIWSADGRELTKLGVSGYNVHGLSWSRDEKYLAAAANMVKVWKFEADEQGETAKLVHIADPHPHHAHRGITALDWSPDGRLAHADLYDGPRFWSLQTGGNQLAFENAGPLSAFAWSPNDEQFVTYNRGVLRSWTEDGHFQRSLAFPTPSPSTHYFQVAWSPDRELLAINHGDARTLAVWRANATEAEPPTVVRLPRGVAVKLAWSPDSQRLAISSHYETNATFVWDRATKNVREVSDPTNDQRAEWLGWSDDGASLVRVGFDGRVQRIDALSGVTTDTFKPDRTGVHPNSYVEGASATGEADRAVMRWRVGGVLFGVQLREPATELWRRDKFYGFVTCHPKQPFVCAADENRRPTLLDLESGKTLGQFGNHRVASAFWSPDGTRLATLPEATQYQGPVNLFHLWKTSPTGAALPEVVGVTLPDGLAASFTPGGAPISLTDAAEKHLTWVIEKPDGRFEYLTRAEFEQRVAEKQEMSRLPIQESPHPPIIDPQASIRGCMFYWPMNEGRGQTTDSIIFSGQQFAARFAGMSGGPEWTTDSAPVTYDNPAALSFDGIDDSLDSGMFRHPDPTKTSLLKHSMTISFWLKTVERKKMSLGGLYSPTNRNIFFLELNHWESWSGIPVPAMTFGVTDKAATRRYLRGIPRNIDLCDGAWHHLVIAWDDKKASAGVAYVDGENVTLLAENGGTTGWPYDFGPLVAPFEFGVTKVVGDDGTVKREAPFKGLLDEFRIYHRVLTEAEIQKLAARREEPKR